MRDLLTPYYHPQFRVPCNVECFFCYELPHPAPQASDSFSFIMEEIEKGREASYEELSLGAGEMLLHPQGGQIVVEACKRGYHSVGLLSNLSSMPEKRLRFVAQSGINAMVGTFACADDASAEAIYARKNVFSKQLKACEIIGEYERIEFFPHLILNRSTNGRFGEMLEAIQSAYGRKLQNAMVSALCITADGLREDERFINPLLDVDLMPIFQKAEEMGIHLYTQNFPLCRINGYIHRDWNFSRLISRTLKGIPSNDPKVLETIYANERLIVEFTHPEIFPASEMNHAPLKTDCPYAQYCRNLNYVDCNGECEKGFKIDWTAVLDSFLAEREGDFEVETIRRLIGASNLGAFMKFDATGHLKTS